MLRFRQRLVDLVLATAPLAAAACMGGGASQPDAGYNPCSVDYMSITKVVPEPPPMELETLVRQCEMDEAKCWDLCHKILVDEGVFAKQVVACDVKHTFLKHTITVGHCSLIVEGRRPAGLVGARKRCVDVTSGHLARAAFFEAASVHAFIQLARELRRHRAPRALVAASRRSAAEEIVHARLMAAHARARGSEPPPVVVSAPRRRSIESIAIENAREGLVGETWSAMLALWQSMHAPDPELRAVYARIADDELRHAELSLEIDRWARSKLAPAACRRVDAVRTRAIAALSRAVRKAPRRELVSELGLPDRAAAAKLFDDARAQIWS